MVVAPFAACSSEPTASPGADSAVDAREEPARGDYFVAPPDAEDAGPVFTQDGWVRLDFDPDYNCGIFAAPSAGKMPPPFEWEPCPAIVASKGWSCQKIKVTWPPPSAGTITMTPPPDGWTDTAGKAWLVVSPQAGASHFRMVAEADGPVHLALTYPRGGACSLTNGSLDGHRFVISAVRDDLSASKILRWGAIGGDVDALPVVLEGWTDGQSRGYFAGPNAYFALGEDAVRPWAPDAGALAKLSITDPGQAGDFVFVGDALFFTVGTIPYHRIKVYTPADGLRDFVSFGNDVSQHAADFGSDGKDMVWTEAFGRATTNDPWATINIVTAPYTSDPTKIVKRRLRSEVGNVGATPFTVGCGYVIHEIYPSGGSGRRLVRLSDGQSWILRGATDGGASFSLQSALAITCDEIFFRAGTTLPDLDYTIVRIRIDSLGPGEAAD
jgi:hypothetical protein